MTPKQMIDEAQKYSQYISVKFTKKNGDERTIVYNPKTEKGLVGDKASELSQQRTETRKASNPDLVAVFDSQLAAKGTPANRCWRSFHVDTIKQVTYKGEVFNY